MENKIDVLRKFFRISVAIFDTYHTVRTALGSNVGKTYMHELHLQAKKEIEKEDPDLSKIDDLIAIMESWTEENKEQPKPDSFDTGGIVYESGSEIIIDKEGQSQTFNFDENNLKEFKDYINALDESVGLDSYTLVDVDKAIDKKLKELKIHTCNGNHKR